MHIQSMVCLCLYVFVVSHCSKVKTLEDELHVATNSLKALEISDEKVCVYL